MGVEGAWHSGSPLKILDERLHADPSRVVLRPFHLGWQAKNAPGGRALKLVHDVAALSEEARIKSLPRSSKELLMAAPLADEPEE